MNGWYIGKQKRELEAEFHGQNGEIFYYFSPYNRFLKDIVFSDNQYKVVCLDGVILNKFELVNKQEDWVPFVEEKLDDSNFINSLRGSFSGFVYNKQTGEITIFTNHTGERPVFYEIHGNEFAATSNFNMLCRNKANINHTIDENALIYLLTYGFMLDDSTVYNNVKRLMPGEKLIYTEEHYRILQYHQYINNCDVIEPDDIVIEKIDTLFKRAVKREFDKDIEYNLKHLVDLSGGLDCRVVNYVAQSMGYSSITNLSYSQNGSDEFKAMVLLNKDLGNELLYYSLDSADFIYDVDKIVNMNYGLCVYSTSTGISRILRYIDNGIFGIEHGGLMGDMRDGAFPGSNYYVHTKADVSKGMQFSTVNKMQQDIPEISSKYKNQELFDIYTRGFLGGLSTQIIRRNFCEYYSPFEDSDFYDYFISLPLEQRCKRKILQKWIEKKYPQAFEIVDDKYMCRINDNKLIISVKTVLKKSHFKLNKLVNKNALTQNNMNPFEYWYKSNNKISFFVDSYINDNFYRIKEFEKVYEMAQKIVDKGTVRDKTMLMTVLSAVKQYGETIQ